LGAPVQSRRVPSSGNSVSSLKANTFRTTATCRYLLRRARTPNACCRIEATPLSVNHCKMKSHRTGVAMEPPAGPRNRPRASHACQRCRAKKAKCDQSQPCSNCVRYSSTCIFTPGNRGGSRRNTSTRDKSSNQDQHPDNTQASSLPNVTVGTSRTAELPRDENVSRPSMSAPDAVEDRASPPRDHASGQSGILDPMSPPSLLPP
jgi:hypothetical protein